MRYKQIYVTIGRDTKPLPQWADEYDLPLKLVYERYVRYGLTGEELLRPEKADMLTKGTVHRLWSGRWVYRNEYAKKYRKPWIFRSDPRTRWVFVGKTA